MSTPDRERYLWDGSGTPDPEIVALERTLSVFRARSRAGLGAAPGARPSSAAQATPSGAAPGATPSGAAPGATPSGAAHGATPSVDARATHPSAGASSTAARRATVRRRIVRPLAAACALIALGALAWYALTPTAWILEQAAHATRADGTPLAAGERLAPGDVILTGAGGSATIDVGSIGSLTLSASSRLRVLASDRAHQRGRLEEGRAHAFIVAAPYVFTIETPHATAHDMGCAYEIETRPGGGTLRVTAGWIDLEGAGRRSLVPAGMVAPFVAGQGPGTPRSPGAEPVFVDALDRLDAGEAAALDDVLAHARPTDAATLVNLVWRVPRGDRGRVFDTLAAWRPPPPSIDRARALDGDLAGLADWWPVLGLARPRHVAVPPAAPASPAAPAP